MQSPEMRRGITPVPSAAERVAKMDVDINAPFVMRALGHLTANMEKVGAEEWATVENAAKAVQLSDAHVSAIETAKRLLASVRDLADKETVLKRAARKLPEIALAHAAIDSMAYRNVGIATDNSILWATAYLRDAASNFATDEDKKAAALITGGILTDEQLEQSKERMRNTNIS
jgi:hypothetical protein